MGTNGSEDPICNNNVDAICKPDHNSYDCPAGEHMVCANTNEPPNHCENGEFMAAIMMCKSNDGVEHPPMCPDGADLMCAGHHHDCPQG